MFNLNRNCYTWITIKGYLLFFGVTKSGTWCCNYQSFILLKFIQVYIFKFLFQDPTGSYQVVRFLWSAVGLTLVTNNLLHNLPDFKEVVEEMLFTHLARLCIDHEIQIIWFISLWLLRLKNRHLCACFSSSPLSAPEKLWC